MKINMTRSSVMVYKGQLMANFLSHLYLRRSPCSLLFLVSYQLGRLQSFRRLGTVRALECAVRQQGSKKRLGGLTPLITQRLRLSPVSSFK